MATHIMIREPEAIYGMKSTKIHIGDFVTLIEVIRKEEEIIGNIGRVSPGTWFRFEEDTETIYYSNLFAPVQTDNQEVEVSEGEMVANN